jgi:hypothetical protein
MLLRGPHCSYEPLSSSLFHSQQLDAVELDGMMIYGENLHEEEQHAVELLLLLLHILPRAAQDVVVHFTMRAIDSYWGQPTPGGTWDGTSVVVGKSNNGRKSARIRIA